MEVVLTMAKASNLEKTAHILVLIGGLNWGLVGAFGLNVVDMLGGMIAKIVYILVGLSALWGLWGLFKK